MSEVRHESLINELARVRDYLEDGKTLQADRCLAWLLHRVKTGQPIDDGPVHWFDYPPVTVSGSKSLSKKRYIET